MCKELLYCIIDTEVTDKVNKGQPLPSVRTSGRARSSTYHSGDCFHRNQRISTAYCRKLRRHGLLWRPVVYRSKYLTVLLIATTLTILRPMQVIHFIWHTCEILTATDKTETTTASLQWNLPSFEMPFNPLCRAEVVLKQIVLVGEIRIGVNVTSVTTLDKKIRIGILST